MFEEKLPQQTYNILEKYSETFYHVVFVEICISYGITPTGFNINVAESSKNFLLLWEELAAAQFKLIELTIIESVQKLPDLETELVLKFSLYTVQEDWFLKTRNHLEKYKKKPPLKKLKKIRMLASTDNLYFACLERFESLSIFSLKV